MYNRTWLIVRTYEKGQKQWSSHSSTELYKTQFFPVSIAKQLEIERILY